MNRVIAAIILFVISLSVGIGCYAATMSLTSDIIEEMEAERTYLEENSSVRPNGTKALSDMWGKKQIFLAAVLPHEELEDIEIGIMNLPDYAEQQFFEEYMKTLNDCINKLKHIQESEKPTIKNIF